MRYVIRIIDLITDSTGRIAHWLSVALVLVMSYEVIMRYAFNSPTMWAYQTAMMIGATIYFLAWSYVQRHGGHIRIDVVYSHLSPRKKAVIDVLGTALLFFPLIFIITKTAAGWAVKSWVINEKMGETYWLPPAFPIRAAFLLGLCLYGLQNCAQFIRDLHLVIRNRPYDRFKS
jgi:TRAP-type mannitol/chloroaromatic compound transport system permease small subunit